MKKVLVLGSAALKIGEAGEFDYSGSQALKALKEEGIQTIVLNPNIATMQTSHTLADEVYLLPVTPHFVEEIIKKERPDGILLSFGGQTALNCGLELWKKGIFEQYNVAVLGTPVESILDTEDRLRFTQRLDQVNASYANSIAAHTTQEAVFGASTIGYPVMVRIAYALGGLGSGVCQNETELRSLAEHAFAHTTQILIEEYLEGWKEIEYEVVRDRFGNCITVCNMENIDPMGIHTGESIVVAPSQTLSNRDYHLLREVAIRVISHLGIVGECNIQYAYHPRSEEYRIIEVNARLSRSSALASKATGYPLAFVAAKLALGYALHEVPNKITKTTTALFEPSLDYVVVKIPKWDLQKFSLVSSQIGSGMKSVGEVMAIGGTFEEALQKGLRMLQNGNLGFVNSEHHLPKDWKSRLKKATDERIFDIATAFSEGIELDIIHALTHIDKWFLQCMQRIIRLAKEIKSGLFLDASKLRVYKQAGFSDIQIAAFRGCSEQDIRSLRKDYEIHPVLRQIDTLAAEFPAQTNYLYLSYQSRKRDIEIPSSHSILILGSGCYRIGSSVEFDWCSVSAAHSLRELGYSTIMLNYNPETVSTDYDESDFLIFDEVSLESILEIQNILKPKGVLVSAGGQLSNNLALPLYHEGLNILGTSAQNIDIAESRHCFSQLLDSLDIDQPPWSELQDLDAAQRFARRVGYPVLVRPSYVLSGAAMTVVPSQEMLAPYLEKASKISPLHPVVISKFIVGAREVECDGVAQRGTIQTHAFSEHVENAGVHSGDATMVLPPQHLTQDVLSRMKEIAEQISSALCIHGPFNIQFLIRDNHMQVIECNLRTSRSFPFVSKILGHNLMKEAIHIMMDHSIPKAKSNAPIHFVGVKAPQFSFARLQGADPRLGVEMSSTGEVGCFGEHFSEALLKAMNSVGYPLELRAVALSAGPITEKHLLLDTARALIKAGVVLYATKGTAQFLQHHELTCVEVSWSMENPAPIDSMLHVIERRKVDLVINIPKNYGAEELSNGYRIRRASVDFNIPLITNAQLAHHYCHSICSLGSMVLAPLPMSSYTIR